MSKLNSRKNVRSIFLKCLAFVVFGVGLTASVSNPAMTEAKKPDTIGGWIQNEAPQLPKEEDLAGEVVPLDAFGVREQLDRELIVNTYHHSSTMLYFKRAARWFPVIEPILRENGLPEDLKYLAIIESGLAQVVSPAGAAGFWQFMKGTAPQYGLKVTRDVDERYHVERQRMRHARICWSPRTNSERGHWLPPRTTWARLVCEGRWKSKGWRRIGNCT